MSAYTEGQIAIEAEKIIINNQGIRTSDLIKKVINKLEPYGDDINILNDTHFSQKVRNLKSHNYFEGYMITPDNKNTR